MEPNLGPRASEAEIRKCFASIGMMTAAMAVVGAPKADAAPIVGPCPWPGD
jgi:hypothetical protein